MDASWLIGMLAGITLPVLVILFVVWVLRGDVLRKQKAVRSPDYWKERPDGRTYPTGWDQSPGAGSARPDDEGRPPGGDGLPPPEGGDPPRQ